jgi:uncharacterized protein
MQTRGGAACYLARLVIQRLSVCVSGGNRSSKLTRVSMEDTVTNVAKAAQLTPAAPATPVAVVQAIYEAFGRGDIPAILGHLADDVEWEYGVNSTDVPWLQPRRGRAAVTGFFEALAALDIHSFKVNALLADAGANVVVALAALDATVRSTGMRIVEEDEAHMWYFDAAGKVARFRHRIDTHQQWKAHHGS